MTPARVFGWSLFIATLMLEMDWALAIAALACLKTLWSYHHGRRIRRAY
jgi:non-ribosomal peptide synthetase component F